MLQPAVNLESPSIPRRRASEQAQCLDISQAKVATYPRLAALSLRNIIWEDGTIGKGDSDIVTRRLAPPPLEDCIVRHRKTLKKLELRDYSINVEDYGQEPPLCYWAEAYKRLANALTDLVELEVNSVTDTRYHIFLLPALPPDPSSPSLTIL